MREFKKGDEVYSLFNGRGVVRAINKKNKNMGHIVEVNSYNYFLIYPYTKDGYYNSSKNRCLFHADEFIGIETDETVPLRPFEIGDKVICLVLGKGEVVLTPNTRENNRCTTAVYFFGTGIVKHYAPSGTCIDKAYKILYHADEKPRVITKDVDCNISLGDEENVKSDFIQTLKGKIKRSLKWK